MDPRLINSNEGNKDGFPEEQIHGRQAHAEGSVGGSVEPTPRLRWTKDLHERFVDAITQLGGPKATPKAIRSVMGVDGLTLYHLKSHLQKYRLGKQLDKYQSEPPRNCSKVENHLDMQINALKVHGHVLSLVSMEPKNTKGNPSQSYLEEVEKHLQLRIDAQSKYMERLMESAQRMAEEQQALASTVQKSKREKKKE